MIQFNRFKLENGLHVIHHFDATTPMAVVNTLYDVGARDESEEKTGFAHLFEHLMFGGSINIPEFDTPLQNAGGENNAFTSNDITNYYDVLPVSNIETAFWLESDRMLSLAFTDKSLEVQRSVVIEEFKQRYLNQPYGDVWLELRPLAYREHPYKWATIGKNIEHIQDATMEDVKAFFKKYYNPSNAILCVAGNISLEETKRLVEKWYGDIPSGIKPERMLPLEPSQKEYRTKTIERAVPDAMSYFAFKMPARKSVEYYIVDLISDAIGRDKSSVLSVKLMKEQQLVSSINAYVLGSMDEGLFIISAKLLPNVSNKQFEEALWKCLADYCQEGISEEEAQQLKLKIRTAKEFEDQSLLNRAMNLCLFELMGDANGINEENEIYQKINSVHLKEMAKKLLIQENCSVLHVIPQAK
jgi:predicted Zn-dependent peptidase